MKNTISFLSLSVAGILLLGWMLATPQAEINHGNSNPVVADGGQQQPPPPYSA